MTKLDVRQSLFQLLTKLAAVANHSMTVHKANRVKTTTTVVHAKTTAANAHKATATVADIIKTVAHVLASAAKVQHLKVHFSQTFVHLNLATSAQRLKASQHQWFQTLKLSNQRVQKTFAVTS